MKFKVLTLIILLVIIFHFFTGMRNAGINPRITYNNSVQYSLQANCTPCHFPPKANRKMLLNTYTAAKEKIDNIIIRIMKSPKERGFMPRNHLKLADSTINIFIKWKAYGLLEK